MDLAVKDGLFHVLVYCNQLSEKKSRFLLEQSFEEDQVLKPNCLSHRSCLRSIWGAKKFTRKTFGDKAFEEKFII